MLVFSSQAWHIRLCKLVYVGHNYKPTNLCSHFWYTMIACVAFLMVGVAAISVGIYCILSWPIRWPISSALEWHHTRYQKISHVSQPREPNLIWAWLVARKRRVCPLIQVRDDKAN